MAQQVCPTEYRYPYRFQDSIRGFLVGCNGLDVGEPNTPQQKCAVDVSQRQLPSEDQPRQDSIRFRLAMHLKCSRRQAMVLIVMLH